jgi:hypothetical protein
MNLRSPSQERVHALRIGCREEARHRAAFGSAKNVCAFDADCVHHRANVVGALFEGGHFHGPIGKPGASLVESDQAAKSAEPLEEERTARNLPVEIEVRHGSWRHDQVDGTVARDLVGDQHIVTTGVLCLGQQLIFGHGVGGVVSSARLANICNGPANCASSRFPYG